ncbi:50S ribosomal protein L11 methyltransferase [Nitriliruptoraceae bacterium ZYF776]|nr:50S ribosomal protein L11 methyltransferase [Profundirhabdus halotolerans]
MLRGPAPTPDAPVPATHRYALSVHPEDAEVVAAELWAAGALGVWERPGELVAWFVARDVDVPPGGTFELEADRDWQAEWKATIQPVRAGRIAVVPTWRVEEHTPLDGEVTLVLDPGRAFGSGHHATTTLCLEALAERDLAGRTVADVGCGSGVLAIAAARLGARAVGSDVDPDAVEVTAENAARNDVAVPAAVGSVAAALELLDGAPADVVVANLVTDTVVALAGELVAACATDGTLVVSGIAAERTERATDALVAAGAEVADVRERDGWIAVVAHPARDGEVAR